MEALPGAAYTHKFAHDSSPREISTDSPGCPCFNNLLLVSLENLPPPLLPLFMAANDERQPLLKDHESRDDHATKTRRHTTALGPDQRSFAYERLGPLA